MRDWKLSPSLPSLPSPKSLSPSWLATSSYNKLIAHYSKESAWTVAGNILQEANQRRIFCDLVTYNSVLALKQWNRSLQLLEQLHRIQLELDLISFNASIASIGSCISTSNSEHWQNNRAWQLALHLASVVRVRKLEPNIITSNSLIMASTRAQRWRQALESWDGLSENRLEPTSMSYTAAMNTCEAAGKWLQALEFLQDMQWRNVTHVVTHTAAISACGKCGDWQGALFLLYDMESLRMQPTLVSINAAMDACAIGNQWLAAMELMQWSGMQWDAITYSSVICACEWTSALSHLTEAHSKTLAQMVLQNSCISAVREQWQRSLQLLLDALQLALEPTLNTLNAAMVACAAEWPQSLQLLSQMGTGTPQNSGNPSGSNSEIVKLFSYLKPDATTFTSVLMSNDGDWQRAFHLFSKFQNFQPDLVAYNALMYACAKGFQWDKTLQILNDLNDLNVIGRKESHGMNGMNGDSNEKSFLIAMHACNLSKKWQHVLLVLEKAWHVTAHGTLHMVQKIILNRFNPQILINIGDLPSESGNLRTGDRKFALCR